MKNKAFTLLELLLVISIISVLVSLVFFAVRPTEIFNRSQDMERRSHMDSLTKAIDLYKAENRGKYPTVFRTLQSGVYDICKAGNSGCTATSVNLDELLSANLMSEIPVDPACNSGNDTCYDVKYNSTTKKFEIVAPGLTGGGPITIAENFDAQTDMTAITGSAAGEGLGYSTAQNAGDINGDGIDDIVVSAPSAQSNLGEVYIFFGGTDIDSNMDVANADVTIVGANYDPETFQNLAEYIGDSISTAGDVNGDGINDLLISARANTGNAYVFYGKSSWQADYSVLDSDIIFVGSKTQDFFGMDVDIVPNFNGDQYADMIIGASGDETTPEDTMMGRLYVFYGAATLPDYIDKNDADFIITGSREDDNLGIAASNAGDVNNDGLDDIVVGAYRAEDTALNDTQRGRAYIFYGSPSRTGQVDASTANIVINGTDDEDQLGLDVAYIGDINGDSIDDIYVGARQAVYDYTNYGVGYVIYGAASLPGSIDAENADVKTIGEGPWSGYAAGLATAGDLNGDGIGDFVATANYGGAVNWWSGRGFVYFGGSALPEFIESVNANVKFEGSYDGDKLGASVGTGDFNDDGYSDLIFGADEADAGGVDSGAVYMYLSNP